MVRLEGFSVSLNNKDSVTRPHFEDDFDAETINCRRAESFKVAERRPDYKIEGFCFSSPTELTEFNCIGFQNMEHGNSEFQEGCMKRGSTNEGIL